ncbi:efflux RND transporter periplasmic adaptor subunit [Vibrio rhodolitus]|uniref:efflux RND transporter periplasmic adaptor subunit n=1 Tax=Vibrio rhodolitus TaxID=2231649 RepID=UPI000E0A7070|nr:efflux RND transporter periplasmic adaptor subunit [Vibrio rhodolitus]
MKLKKVMATLAGVGAIITALVLIDILEPQPVKVTPKRHAKPPVTVLEVTPSTHTTELILLATTSVYWSMQLKAPSSARLDWLNLKIEPGALVKKGTRLAKLDTSELEFNLAQANSSVKQAELNLQHTLHEQTVALKMLSPDKSSAFARREPQVLAAKAALKQAEHAYTSAATILAQASITVPFDAVIIRRHISPGEWLEEGQVLYELAASDSLDVSLPVSEMHWQQVHAALRQDSILVENREGNQWKAQVRYVAPQADVNTRQKEVVFSVSHPYQGATRLLPNQQVKVTISLGEQDNIAVLPVSSITRDGEVWTLDKQNRLQKESVEKIAHKGSKAYVRFVQNSDRTRQVVLYPLISMLPGKEVMPTAEKTLIAQKDSRL